MGRGGWTYILTNKPFSVLYVGVTSELVRRMEQHRQGLGPGFCKRFNLTRLVLVEEQAAIEDAIVREKRLKEWNRAWKLRLVCEGNSEWRDLASDWLG